MTQGPFTFLAKALIGGAKDIGFTGPTSASSSTITNILYPVYFWAGVAAVIVIIVAGFFFTTSHGDPNLVTRAKNAITGAVIGLAVIFLAFAITAIVIGVFG
jgi:cytochrome bd-type quinol oxidase subunit 2